MKKENNMVIEQDPGITEVHSVQTVNGVTSGVKVLEFFPEDEHIEILGHKMDSKFSSMEEFEAHIKRVGQLEMENKLYKHRLKVANEFIDSRKESIITEHYDNLKYILNECDLNHTW